MIDKGRAFTLIELLISSAIFAVIMVTIYVAFYTGLFGYNDITENIEICQDARQIFSRINLDLRNSFSYSQNQAKFSGEGTGLNFLTLVDSFSELQMLTEYAFVSYRFEDGRLFRSCKKNKEALNDEVSGKEQEMASGIKELSFDYGYLDAPDKPIEWKEAWDNPNALPAAVKVKIVFQNKVSYEFERVIFLTSG